MAESKEETVERLMKEGLDRYAMGEDAQAIECWRQVLELDPEHAEAQDYLRTADADADDAGASTSESAATEQNVASAPRSLLDEALAMVAEDKLEESFELLETASRVEPGDLHVHALIELVRGRLRAAYCERLCDGIAVPQLRVSADEMARFNLPATADLVLQGVDGTNSVNDVVDGAAIDPFDALRTCCRLIDAGIIEVHP